MPAQVQPSPRPRPVRCRAAKACQRCNEKRVKCDAVERGTPCTRCEKRNEPDCVLIQSRRGIYVRKPRRQTTKQAQDREYGSNSTTTSSPPQERGAEVETHPQAPDGFYSPPRTATTSEGHDTRPGEQAEAEHALPTSAELALAAQPEHDTPSGHTDASNASSYRDISWAAMFDHFLEGQHNGEGAVDKCSITYLGESFPLAIVLKDLRGGAGPPKLHHPGPPCPENDGQDEPRMHHPPYMRPEDIAFLEAKKAFETPNRETLDALVGVFLSRVFPIYPIVNRQEFLKQYNARRVPWILLHALCFISATFCPVHILYRAGFESRRQARWSFYSKAKALFDTGYEGNKIVMLQASILMTFWGGGPNNYWNFYSWISTGVTIAETLGFHRSMAGTNIKPQDRSLLKRLWWILVVRDTSCAALVGRPFRVNLDHCDIDPLTPEDFQHDADSPDFEGNSQRYTFGLYQIQIMKLSLILRHIIMSRFVPRGAAFAPSALRQMLKEWRSQLPPQLDWTENASYSSMFSSTLSILYNHHMIIAHLNCPPESVHTSPGTYSEPSCSEDISNAAAQSIAAAACAVVTKSDVLLAPHELFHGIFLAAVVFYTQTKNTQSVVAQLGRAGLTNCQMVLHDSRDVWDPSPWITQLFDKLLGTPSRECSPRAEEDHVLSSMQISMDNSSGAFVGDGMFSAGFDLWQSHPVLGNLFDVPSDGMQSSLGDGLAPWI